MSQEDEEFLRRLRATFKVEAAEHIQAMSSQLLALEKTSSPESATQAIEAVFRHAHSLKGAARAINLSSVETLCQSLETVFAAWKAQTIAPTPEAFDRLHRAIDTIARLVNTDDPTPGRDENFSAILRGLSELVSASALFASAPVEPARATPAAAASIPSSAPPAAPAPTSAPVAVSAAAETIRVSTAKLDRLLLEAEEMLALKQVAAQRASDLGQLEQTFEQWNRQWLRLEPQLRAWQGSPSVSADAAQSAVAEFLEWNSGYVRSLGNRLRALAKSAAQDRHAATKHVDDLLEDSKQLVMLPFSTLADLFPKLVRDLSRDQGKPVDLVIRGGEVEIDKRILEEMKDALIHLVRNSIDHGIEPPRTGDRRQNPERATLTIVAKTAGDKVELLVSDDGAGIDLNRVKDAAVKRGLITADDARSLDERQTLDLIFQSDVSTSPIITEISGRGLGLAIVREKAEKLGGRVAVETRRGEGTTFRITLPLTLATFRAIAVRCAEQTFVIPTVHVERVARVKTTDVKTLENRETVSFDHRAVALVRLEDVLALTRNQPLPPSDFLSIILLGSGEERIAFAVDTVLHDEEILAKRLERPLVRVRNIAGATILASGRLVPILNAADLMKSARRSDRRVSIAKPSPTAGRPDAPKSVLVAEDSITSRMLLKGILESAGFRVTTAVDGVEAWTTLRTNDFDLIVSDVEMPRMNGFDLCARIRADKKLADKPVVLVTALASAADRERGIDVGASAYIVKSSFDQGNLLEVIRRLA